MKKILSGFAILFVLIGMMQSAYALSINQSTPYTNYAVNRAKYYPTGTYARNRFIRQQRNNYIYSPQQARYNGYRSGIYGTGYNNTYYYNRYRR